MKEWKLIDAQGNEFKFGDKAVSFRGESAVIAWGRPPQHAASTGRVYTDYGCGYFPSVFNLKWVH